jgi:hypothetical protein
VEAWEFLLGGGAVYSNLSYAYQVDNPRGEHPESDEFKRYLGKLKAFLDSLDFIRMRPDRAVIAGGLGEDSFWRALSEAGKAYAIYVHHSSYAQGRRRYEVTEKPRKLELVLELPRGDYRVEWIRPTDLTPLAAQRIEKHSGGTVRLAPSPEHTADIAIRVAARR